MDAEVNTHTFRTMIIEESVCFISFAKYLKTYDSVVQYSNTKDMHVTQDLNSLGEIIAHAQYSVDEQNKYIFRAYSIRITVKKPLKSVCMFVVLAIVVETN
jgi:hypothetical protein